MSSSPARLYGTTGTSFVRLEEAEDGWTLTHGLPDSGAQCLAADPSDPGVVYVGLVSGGVRKTTDGGRSWEDCGLAEQQVFSVAVSAADGAVYVGTEPSALYRSDDGGRTWTELSGLLELPSRPTWSFPPRPWTSHVRWVAPAPHDAATLLAGIELGGLMRSTDRGETWQDHRPGAHRDVHSLAWHPRVPGRAYEAGGEGAAWSDDGGDTWKTGDESRDRLYTWSVTVDPEEPDLWYVSASTGPFAAHGGGDPQASVYRRRNGGWERLAGLPDPLPSMPYALVATEDRLFAGLASGELWESRDRGDSWQQCSLLGNGLTRLLALVSVPR